MPVWCKDWNRNPSAFILLREEMHSNRKAEEIESGQPCLACLQVEKKNRSVERCSEGRRDGPKERRVQRWVGLGPDLESVFQFLVPSLHGTYLYFSAVSSFWYFFLSKNPQFLFNIAQGSFLKPKPFKRETDGAQFTFRASLIFVSVVCSHPAVYPTEQRFKCCRELKQSLTQFPLCFITLWDPGIKLHLITWDRLLMCLGLFFIVNGWLLLPYGAANDVCRGFGYFCGSHKFIDLWLFIF